MADQTITNKYTKSVRIRPCRAKQEGNNTNSSEEQAVVSREKLKPLKRRAHLQRGSVSCKDSVPEIIVTPEIPTLDQTHLFINVLSDVSDDLSDVEEVEGGDAGSSSVSPDSEHAHRLMVPGWA